MDLEAPRPKIPERPKKRANPKRTGAKFKRHKESDFLKKEYSRAPSDNVTRDRITMKKTGIFAKGVRTETFIRGAEFEARRSADLLRIIDLANGGPPPPVATIVRSETPPAKPPVTPPDTPKNPKHKSKPPPSPEASPLSSETSSPLLNIVREVSTKKKYTTSSPEDPKFDVDSKQLQAGLYDVIAEEFKRYEPKDDDPNSVFQIKRKLKALYEKAQRKSDPISISPDDEINNNALTISGTLPYNKVTLNPVQYLSEIAKKKCLLDRNEVDTSRRKRTIGEFQKLLEARSTIKSRNFPVPSKMEFSDGKNREKRNVKENVSELERRDPFNVFFPRKNLI